MEQKHSVVLGLVFIIALLFSTNGMGIPDQETKNVKHETEINDENMRNVIILIGLSGSSKNSSEYGIISILEKDILKLVVDNTTTTVADKNVVDSRKFSLNSDEDSASESSRLLNLLITPKKALVLYALLKSQVGKSCVTLSKIDLENLLNAARNATADAAEENSGRNLDISNFADLDIF